MAEERGGELLGELASPVSEETIKELQDAASLARAICRALPIHEEMDRLVDQRMMEIERQYNRARRVLVKRPTSRSTDESTLVSDG